MRCKKIQNILKSDYLDGFLDQDGQKEVLEHLEACDKCRILEKELKEQRVFFQKTQKQAVPGHIWQNIKHDILKGQLERKAYSGALERLKAFLFPGRRVFALVSATAAVAIIMVLAGRFIRGNIISSKEKNSLILTDYVLNAEGQELLSGLGTNVEEYFL